MSEVTRRSTDSGASSDATVHANTSAELAEARSARLLPIVYFDPWDTRGLGEWSTDFLFVMCNRSTQYTFASEVSVAATATALAYWNDTYRASSLKDPEPRTSSRYIDESQQSISSYLVSQGMTDGTFEVTVFEPQSKTRNDKIFRIMVRREAMAQSQSVVGRTFTPPENLNERLLPIEERDRVRFEAAFQF